MSENNKKITQLLKQAETYKAQGEYAQAALLYEQAISEQPTTVSHYWYLGLVLLLQGREEDAQLVWMNPLLYANANLQERWTTELAEILQAEAIYQEEITQNQIAWMIRQHLREFEPENIDNLMCIVKLSVQLYFWDESDTILSQLTECLNSGNIQILNENLLKETFQKILDFASDREPTFDFIEACLTRSSLIYNLAPIFFDRAANFLHKEILSQSILAKYAALYIKLQPNNIPVLVKLINLYQDLWRYDESLKLAKQLLEQSKTIPDRIAAHYLILKNLMSAGGNFDRANEAHQVYERLVRELIESDVDLDRDHLTQLIITSSFFSYLQDNPQKNHQFKQRFSSFLNTKIRNSFQETVYQSRQTSLSMSRELKTLKIGYISSCFRRNSVGYIVRWLLRHHDRNTFAIYAYSLQRTDDEVQQFIASQVSVFRDLSQSQTIPKIATKIHQDEIDILVDLDSLTSHIGCAVMALKPAPIQVTWLGFDASEIPTIDYFIADPYVLPEAAQNYYSETILRLPQTYVAVDGFEVGVPTLRREDLDIPPDALIYFSSQTGPKRHPDNVRLQMRILREVPNSYFIIKGLYTDRASLQTFFEQLAKEEGVEFDRLRFLPDVSSEATHRANLSIADVVLDTYPYNGTTTTLETLWMEVPVVTRVGEQFSSRQGYTLLMNAGITEGIARTNEDYLEWGIRLGKDAQLRQQIAWKLRRAKQTAPLWNTKQFALDIETAYQQMWEQYLERT
jgi:predicted O-linked N-acetylglucosamine transferase (SPINDLY family)